MAILFSDNTYRGDTIYKALQAAMPQIDLRKYPDTGNADEIDYAIIWYPAPGSLKGLSNLKAIFTVSAGVDAILTDQTLPDVPLVRSVNEGLTQGMVEHIVYNVLRFHRHHHIYDAQQREAIWKQLPQIRPQHRRIGIVGFGELGSACAEILLALKFPVAAWSRSPKDMTGVQSFAGLDTLPDFLAQTDILVNLLPLTHETSGILNKGLFAQLPKGAFLINAGRGKHMVEQDVLAALDSDQLSAAALDVFAPEPLLETSPFWLHPKVTLTPHIASITDFTAVAQSILKQIEAFEGGKDLKHIVDRGRQY